MAGGPIDDLALSLLGNPLIERDGHPVNLERHKALALLAYLAVSGATHRRDTLATLFWPELDQTRARGALRRTLSTLHIALAGNWLQIDRETIGVAPSASFRSDVSRFHELLAQCREHGHSEAEVCPECLKALRAAAILYRGDFLSGFSLRDTPSFDDWQMFQTETLRGELASVLERLGHGYSAREDYITAISHVRRWLELDPLQEPAQRQLMRLYAWSGQRNAALRQYGECVGVLERELGIPPQAATTELYSAIREDRLPPPAAEFRIPADASSAPAEATRPFTRDPVGPELRRGPRDEVDDARDTLLLRIVRGRLVGRERELAQAESLWAHATAGDGRILFISGEPGIGKTRLAHELARLAEAAGATVLMDACHPEGGPPYAPLAGMMRKALDDSSGPDIPAFILADLLALAPHLRPRYPHIGPNPSLDPAFEQQRMFDSFVGWCEMLAAHMPLLLVVEDIHWADVSTLALLRHLARRVPTTRLMLVMSYRDAEVEPTLTHPLNATLLEFNRERRTEHIKLARLSREQTRELLAAMLPSAGVITPEFLDSLYNETEGNPFFVEEVCKGLIEQGKLYPAGGTWRRADMQTIFIPPGVRDAIMGRVQRLSPAAQDALRVAAIVGRDFDFETLHDASGQGEDALLAALERAQRAQLVEESPRTDRSGGPVTYTFGHALVPFALRESLGGLRRQRLHERVGAAMEIRRPNDFEALAYHFLAAGKRGKAIEYSRRAAERAHALYAYDTAIQYLQTALDLIEAGQQNDTRLILLENLAGAHSLSGDQAEAMAHYRQALALLQNPPHGGDPWTAVRLYRKMGETFNRLRTAAEIEQFNGIVVSGFQSALKLIDGQPPHPESARLLTTLAKYCYWSTSQPYEQFEALSDNEGRYARGAVAMAEQLDAPADLSAALEALASFYSTQGMLRERLQVALRRLALSRDPRFTDRREQVNILCEAGLALCSVGENAEALDYLIQAEQMAEEIRDPGQVILALEMQAQCLFGMDRWDEVSQVEDKGDALRARYGSDRVGRICRQCGVSAYIYGLRGEMELSRAHREAAYIMMTEAWGPLENWPAIGHF